MIRVHSIRISVMEEVHISVGSMLARSTLVGMQEPQYVGRVKSMVPTSFLCRHETIQKLLEAELGGGEAKFNKYEQSIIVIHFHVHFNISLCWKCRQN